MKSIHLIVLAFFVLNKKSYAFDFDPRNVYIKKMDYFRSNTLPFRRIFGQSLRACAFQCAIRSKCIALDYILAVRECDLLDAVGTTTTDGVTAIHVEKTDIDLDDECDCNGQSCQCQKAGTVSVEECEPVRSVEHGKIFGNLFSKGSKMKVKCDIGYSAKDDNSIACLGTGEWEPITECIKDDQAVQSDNTNTPDKSMVTFEPAVCKLSYSCTGQKDAYHADIADQKCKRWFRCQNEQLLQCGTCPEGTVLDEEIQICNWKYAVKAPCGTK